jgi:hypothetical protein
MTRRLLTPLIVAGLHVAIAAVRVLGLLDELQMALDEDPS